MNLNARALRLVDELAAVVGSAKIQRAASGTRLVDLREDASDARRGGELLTRICMADLADVQLLGDANAALFVRVATDQPLLACMASQYAGWEIKGDGYFAMGSGPMRAAAAREPLFDDIGYRETADACVGVLESGKLPPAAVCLDIAAKCSVAPENLTLCVAPTRSFAGRIQIVARSVETAMHKLHELKFDLTRIVAGEGIAPVPPPAENDMAAIGSTNDAILYGSSVSLSLRGDDDSLAAIGSQIPSSASRDYGRPFAQIMAAYDNDFYKVDPLLFSPARIRLVNVDTGRVHEFGMLDGELLEASWGVKLELEEQYRAGM